MENQFDYLSKKIRTLMQNVRHEHYQVIMGQQYDGYFEEDYKGYTEFWINERIKDIYYLILTFLESKNLPTMAARFEREFLASISDPKKLMETSQSHPEAFEENALLGEFDRYLMPFKEFRTDFKETSIQNNQLISVLGNTGHILNHLKTAVLKEADIYRLMQWFLSQYYPTTRFSQKAGFIQRFKTYRPDILIPELKTAIEYKYLDKPDDNVDTFLDQISVDAKNFSGDPLYENFVAVMYFEHVVTATPESIIVAWNEKHFPSNWKLVITGASIKNKNTVSP